jgi:hypothetical protein
LPRLVDLQNHSDLDVDSQTTQSTVPSALPSSSWDAHDPTSPIPRHQIQLFPELFYQDDYTQPGKFIAKYPARRKLGANDVNGRKDHDSSDDDDASPQPFQHGFSNPKHEGLPDAIAYRPSSQPQAIFQRRMFEYAFRGIKMRVAAQRVSGYIPNGWDNIVKNADISNTELEKKLIQRKNQAFSQAKGRYRDNFNLGFPYHTSL